MLHDVVETLTRLVRIPSVNPMGRDVQGSEYCEYAVTAFLQEYFEHLGVPWYRQPVAPLRDNIQYHCPVGRIGRAGARG